MKILSNVINIYKNIVNFVEISEHLHETCTLAQSHRLTCLLETSGTNLQASGVFKYTKYTNFEM